ncbi:F-box protein [Spatholobus suberectus]|nr:F-box protein [Spatholobus suberectus]
MDNIEPGGNISLLNLPEPVLDCILRCLSPMDLVRMSEVCICLRDRCRSDYLWEDHIKKKWGRLIGDVAYKEWQCHITTTKEKGNQLSQQNIRMDHWDLSVGLLVRDALVRYDSKTDNFQAR